MDREFLSYLYNKRNEEKEQIKEGSVKNEQMRKNVFPVLIPNPSQKRLTKGQM